MTLCSGPFGRNDECVLCNTDRASWAERSSQEVAPHGSEGESPLRVGRLPAVGSGWPGRQVLLESKRGMKGLRSPAGGWPVPLEREVEAEGWGRTVPFVMPERVKPGMSPGPPPGAAGDEAPPPGAVEILGATARAVEGMRPPQKRWGPGA